MSTEMNQTESHIRADFEGILEFVKGEQACTATAGQIEQGLLVFLLNLGAQLMLLFFQMRSQACCRDDIVLENGQVLPYHSEQKRTYFSIFGYIPLCRPYFYKKGIGGQTPLDAELSLASDRYSDVLRDIVEYIAVYVPSYGKAMDILDRIFHFKVSTRVVQKMVIEDANDVEAYYDQKPSPDPAEEAEIMVVQADGKGIPMVLEEVAAPQVRLGKGQKRGRKKESIVTTAYTAAHTPRTPEEVVEGLFHPENEKENKTVLSPPQNKHVWATLDGKDAALTRLAQRVAARQGEHIQARIALADGDPSLQSRIESYLPGFTLILDFIHPTEYLWDVANALFAETDERRVRWVEKQTLLMLSSKTKQVIANLRKLEQQDKRTKRQRKALTTAANYFERNLHRMDYKSYLEKGWPIASGVIEGACRHFVKDRFELSGMRWTQDGAEQLLHLRAIAENGDWDTYQHYRQQQRHERLYQSPFPNQDQLEFQSLELAA